MAFDRSAAWTSVSTSARRAPASTFVTDAHSQDGSCVFAASLRRSLSARRRSRMRHAGRLADEIAAYPPPGLTSRGFGERIGAARAHGPSSAVGRAPRASSSPFQPRVGSPRRSGRPWLPAIAAQARLRFRRDRDMPSVEKAGERRAGSSRRRAPAPRATTAAHDRLQPVGVLTLGPARGDTRRGTSRRSCPHGVRATCFSESPSAGEVAQQHRPRAVERRLPSRFESGSRVSVDRAP